MTDKPVPSTISVAFTPQQLADLRHLINVAIWIRTEQVMNESVALMTVAPVLLDATLPPVTIINENLNVARAMKDLDFARAYWVRFNQMLKDIGKQSMHPSWYSPEDFKNGT